MHSIIKIISSYAILTIILVIIFINYSLVGCVQETAPHEEEAMPPKTIQEVLKDHTQELMSIDGVIGTAVGEQKGELCIRVLVIQKTPELTEKIPSTLEGFTVVIQQTGEIRALDKR